MTSLIYGAIYLGHKGITEHRREKQRKKNYERWEGLRDEYDEQKRSTSDQRGQSSADYPPPKQNPLFTLRDQQEAGDARTSWRPQETWNNNTGYRHSIDGVERPPMQSAQVSRNSSLRVPSNLNVPALAPRQRPQKTGATWDEGLPPPLQVSRRSFEDDNCRPQQMTATSSAESLAAAWVPSNSTSLRGRSASVESNGPRRSEEEVHVVESPFEWWKR